jgi:ferredoxin-type protein NapH
MKTRQKVRRVAIIAMFLLLPVTLYYFSPILSIQGAAFGIVGGSIIMFAALFLSSLFLGRLFCGWACPAGGAQEIVMLFRKKPVNRKQINWIKWLIWTPWVTMLVFFLLRAGGVKRVDFFYLTTNGISVADLPGIIAYVSVVSVFFLLALAIGKRAGCHTICWMAPFMMIGRSIRNFFGWPALRLVASDQSCAGCGKCARECPMSIDVMRRVKESRLETRDCILCGSCVDACPHQVIRYSISAEKSAMRSA